MRCGPFERRCLSSSLARSRLSAPSGLFADSQPHPLHNHLRVSRRPSACATNNYLTPRENRTSHARDVCSPVSDTTGAQSIASQPMSMPTRAASSEVQLDAMGSLDACRRCRISTSDSRPVRQRPVAAVQLELQFAPVGRAKARAAAAIVQVDAVELRRACRRSLVLAGWTPRRCRRRTAALLRDRRAGSRRFLRPDRRCASVSVRLRYQNSPSPMTTR